MVENETSSEDGAVVKYIPGMKPGSTKRNAGVAILYILFPILIPFVLAYMFITNRAGVADQFNSVPTISEGGGLVSALVPLFIGLIIVSMASTVLPWADYSGSDDTGVEEPNGASDAEEEDAEAEADEEDESAGEEEEVDEEDNVIDEGGDDPPPEETEADDDDSSDDTADTDDADVSTNGTDEAEDAEQAEEQVDNEEESLTEEEVEIVFVSVLNQEGIEPDRAEHTDSPVGFTTEYTSTVQSEQELAGEIGYVAGAYAGVVDEGHGDGGMTVYVHNQQGDLAFTYFVSDDLAQSYNDDEITSEEFSAEVIGTIETYQ